MAKPVRERLHELRKEIADLLAESKLNRGKQTERGELRQVKRLQQMQAILKELMAMTDRKKLHPDTPK